MIKELAIFTSLSAAAACSTNIKPKKSADRTPKTTEADARNLQEEQGNKQTEETEQPKPGIDPELKKNPLDVTGLTNPSLNDHP